MWFIEHCAYVFFDPTWTWDHCGLAPRSARYRQLLRRHAKRIGSRDHYGIRTIFIRQCVCVARFFFYFCRDCNRLWTNESLDKTTYIDHNVLDERLQHMCLISFALFINIPDHRIYTETLLIFWPISIIATYVTVNICKDIRQSKDLLQHYKAWATTDFSTGLYNVRQFHTVLSEKMAQVKQQNSCLALILFDIDRFKSINDSHGHDGGDVILRHLGELIRSLVPKNGLAFRNGGEEFSILLISCEHEAAAFAEHVRTTIERHPFVVQKQTVHITVSIGISLFPTFATNETELFKQADIALYEAKQQGRNRTVVYKKQDLHET